MAHVAAPHAVRRPSVLVVGTVVWLASELMFFSGIFAAYFTLRDASAEWPPGDVELETVLASLFTVVLVASSVTIQLAVGALHGGRVRAFRWWTALSAALGTVFLLNQAREWAALDFGIGSHSYGSIFFLSTGFHGLHVAGGIVAMLILLVRSGLPRFGPRDVPSVEVVSAYWHFVDVVWLALFATLFFVR